MRKQFRNPPISAHAGAGDQLRLTPIVRFTELVSELETSELVLKTGYWWFLDVRHSYALRTWEQTIAASILLLSMYTCALARRSTILLRVKYNTLYISQYIPALSSNALHAG
jgi:hypothetical protein